MQKFILSFKYLILFFIIFSVSRIDAYSQQNVNTNKSEKNGQQTKVSKASLEQNEDSAFVAYTRYFLKNDMRVILCPDSTARTVTTVMMYRAGSKDESPDRTGFAHFFEHLLFEGSRNIPRGEIDNIIQNSGGSINALTTNDYTAYYTRMPANQLKLALWIESERMTSAIIDDEGVEKQRKIIREERKQNIENKPFGYVTENILAYTGLGTPYSWAPIGSVQYIDRAKVNEFKDFYQKYYVPNNAILVLVGNFDTTKAKNWIEEYFSTIPKGAPIPRPQFDWKLGSRDIIMDIKDSKNEVPAISYSYRVPGKRDSTYLATAILSKILCEGKSSKISQSLILQNLFAIDVQGLPLFFEKGGIINLFATMPTTTPFDVVMLAFDREIATMINGSISDAEITRAKNILEREMVEERTNPLDLALRIGEFDFYFQKPSLINKEISMMKSVTKADIVKVAKQYLTYENRIVIRYNLDKM